MSNQPAAALGNWTTFKTQEKKKMNCDFKSFVLFSTCKGSSISKRLTLTLSQNVHTQLRTVLYRMRETLTAAAAAAYQGEAAFNLMGNL